MIYDIFLYYIPLSLVVMCPYLWTSSSALDGVVWCMNSMCTCQPLHLLFWYLKDFEMFKLWPSSIRSISFQCRSSLTSMKPLHPYFHLFQAFLFSLNFHVSHWGVATRASKDFDEGVFTQLPWCIDLKSKAGEWHTGGPFSFHV